MAEKMGSPYLFLDRDDTLIYDESYLADPDKIRFVPGACEALRALCAGGYRLALVTNQSGVGRGYFTMAQLEAVHQRLKDLLAMEALVLDGIFICPHAPSEKCHCRKPETGMLEEAARVLDVDRKHSVMIGDNAKDVLLGKNFGLRTVRLALPGKTPETFGADVLVSDPRDAVPVLLKWLAPQG